MIHLNVWLTVKDPQQLDEIRGLLVRAAQSSRTEPGCLRFEVYQSKNQPTRFLLHERWASQEALDQHRKAHAYTTIYQPHIMPRVERDGHPCELVDG